MDDDLVFVPDVGQPDGDAAAEVFEDFVDVKDEFRQEEVQAQVRLTPSIAVVYVSVNSTVMTPSVEIIYEP